MKQLGYLADQILLVLFELGVAVEELSELFDTDGASTLLFLPLAHVFARIIQVGAVKSRTRLGHSADIKNLVADLGEFRPTFILAVPRVFEKVFNSASQRATADGRGRVFDRAADVAIAWSRAQDGSKVPVRLRAQHALFEEAGLYASFDSSGLDQPPVENRVAALHDIKFAVGKEWDGDLECRRRFAVAVPVVNRRVVDLAW